MVYFCQTYLIIRSSLTNTFTLTEKVLRRNEKSGPIIFSFRLKLNLTERERNEEQKGEREKLNNRSSRFFTQLSDQLRLNRNFANGPLLTSQSSDCRRTLSNLSKLGGSSFHGIPWPFDGRTMGTIARVDPHACCAPRSAGCGPANIVSGSIT